MNLFLLIHGFHTNTIRTKNVSYDMCRLEVLYPDLGCWILHCQGGGNFSQDSPMEWNPLHRYLVAPRWHLLHSFWGAPGDVQNYQAESDHGKRIHKQKVLWSIFRLPTLADIQDSYGGQNNWEWWGGIGEQEKWVGVAQKFPFNPGRT